MVPVHITTNASHDVKVGDALPAVTLFESSPAGKVLTTDVFKGTPRPLHRPGPYKPALVVRGVVIKGFFVFFSKLSD